MRLFLSLMAIFGLSACATVSKITIEDRLRDLGLNRAQASCVADELEKDLSDRQLREFAAFTDQISDPDGFGSVMEALGRISDVDTARALAGASVSCAFAR